MTNRTDSAVKVTVTLSPDLLAFADQHARRLGTNRSRLIGLALLGLRNAEEARLAAEGYRFYRGESCEFAEASAHAVAKAIANAG